MAGHRIRTACLLGALAALAVSPARAQEVETAKPKTRTIQVVECCPETYQVKRTCYRIECKTEEYDTFKCIYVPEVREREVTVVKRIPVMTTETRKVPCTTMTWEERTVMKPCYKTVQETVMCKKLVSLGHWECREVKALFSCDPCCTRTRKVWVCCPQYVECPKTVCKKVCTMVPTTCKVPVCHTVYKDVQVQVCSYRCETEKRTEKCTVYVQKQVPCKATRVVRTCVPYEVTETCVRYVPRTVTREVCDVDCCPERCRTPIFTGCRFRCSNCCR